MNVITGVRLYLLADPAIAAVVAARIYPVTLPQPKKDVTNYPALTVTLVDEFSLPHLRGVGGLFEPRLQLDSWAPTYDATTALDALCRERLNGFAGLWVDATSPAEDLDVAGLFWADSREFVERDIHGGLFRKSTDYFVKYRSLGVSA